MNSNISSLLIGAALLSSIIFSGCESKNSDEKKLSEELIGPYLGQIPPGNAAKLFAPGLVSTGMNTRDVAITPDLKELYFNVSIGNYKYSTILCVKEINGKWTGPKVAEFARDLNYRYTEPAISPDGSKFYFISDMPNSGKRKTDMDIWVMDREGDKWGDPYNLGSPVNSDLSEYFPSLTEDGTIYFTRDNPDRTSSILRSRIKDGKYGEPELLGPEVNAGRSRYNAFISPDESFIIVPTYGMEDSFGATDYYISFRDENDNWSGPFNMGPKINSADRQEWSPYISPDGKYFFFMSARIIPGRDTTVDNVFYDDLKNLAFKPQNGNSDIYWIDAEIIEELKNDLLNK